MTTRRGSRKAHVYDHEKLQAIYRAGFTAYGTPGVPRAPGIDPVVRMLLKDARVGSLLTQKAFEFWMAGWDKAADEAAAEALRVERDSKLLPQQVNLSPFD